MASRYLRMRPSLVLRTQPLRRARIGLHPSNPAARRTASTTATAAEDAAARTARTAPTPAAVSTTAAQASPRVVETSAVSRLRVVFFATSVGLTLFAGYLYVTDTRASVHRWLVPPLIRALFPDAEDAHHYGTQSLKILYCLGLHPRDRTNGGDDLAVSVFPHANEYKHEHTLANPIGISAGLDKDAEIPDALFALGAAVVEVGGCTPRPQAGNPRPRLFRVPGIDGMAVWASGVDGVIVGNTTKRRTGLVPGRLRLTGAEQRALAETGGFSGPAMFERTRALVARYRHRLDEHALRGGSAATADGTAAGPLAPKTLFASGGLTTGDQALQLLNAGASVAMLYTGLIYGGAGTVTRIKEEMREQLSRPLPAP
ncbi:dihydroorotate reductase [Niveomyces insectorum RCEF 264]|uniref:Dihydroorotate reductase n=1 Tax=Niveomyces insectorum RCEF 264 TaxID=1081102 RepID=A0A167YP61_9HYPO|nr:dihydroorotate reductase [Niveomyces insectorum RCEF 264]